MTQTAIHATPEMELLGRQAAAHIRHWQQYGKKAEQHRISAAQCIRQARDTIGHGEWYPWLKAHGIKPRTASRLLFEARNPEAAEKRRAEQAARDKEARVYGKSATRGRNDKQLTPLEQDRRTLMNLIRKLQDHDTIKELLANLQD